MSEFNEGPEWGWCTHTGCHEAALPIWLSDGPPSDPDMFLCHAHIGLHIAALQESAELAVRGFRRWKRNQRRGGDRHEAEHGLTDLGQAISDLDAILNPPKPCYECGQVHPENEDCPMERDGVDEWQQLPY